MTDFTDFLDIYIEKNPAQNERRLKGRASSNAAFEFHATDPVERVACKVLCQCGCYTRNSLFPVWRGEYLVAKLVFLDENIKKGNVVALRWRSTQNHPCFRPHSGAQDVNKSVPTRKRLTLT